MAFLGDFGKLLKGAVQLTPIGRAASIISAVTSRPRPSVPMITPTVPQVGTFAPAGPGAGGFAVDSIIHTRGPLPWQTRTGVYGARGFISNYPVGGGGPMPDGGGGAGGVVNYNVPSCPMPVGRHAVALMPSPCRGYHWNRGRYYVFGDCRTGSEAGPVEPGTRLVRNRRINPANAKAAYRAARRLNGTLTLLRKIERVTGKLVRRSARGSHRGGACRTGKCKGACKCR